MKKFLKKNSLMNTFYSALVTLPSPMNLKIFWNFGSLLGTCLMIQIISGLFLSMHYDPNIYKAFSSVIHIMQDINNGWFMRFIHMNGASWFFMMMYLHIGRNLYYSSFKLTKTWFIGIIMFLMTMITAFLGYVLPWGQMSFWGATVITNLLSAVPYIGKQLVYWLWGGFSVNNPTLNRFFTFHFIMPFIIMLMVIFHLYFLHSTGSSNPLGMKSKNYKIMLYPYFIYKDLMGIIIMLTILFLTCMIKPYIFADPENYIKANPMSTPMHIQPEWYFLFAYTILRSIPNKLGGVIALLMSILILFILPFMKTGKFKSIKFNFMNKTLYWWFISIFFSLTWIGMKPIENPFIIMGQTYSILYFMYFLSFNQLMYPKKF